MLSNIDTSNTNPIQSTTVKDNKLLRTISIMELLVVFPTTYHTVFSVRFICQTSIVPTKSKDPKPITVPTMLPWLKLELSTATATASAASAPTAFSSCAIICAIAASVLSNKPKICTAKITTGAIENKVKNASAPAKINDWLRNQISIVSFIKLTISFAFCTRSTPDYFD